MDDASSFSPWNILRGCRRFQKSVDDYETLGGVVQILQLAEARAPGGWCYAAHSGNRCDVQWAKSEPHGRGVAHPSGIGATERWK